MIKFYDSVDDINIRDASVPPSTWKSKLYDFGDLALKKKVYKIEITYKNGTASGNTGLVPTWNDDEGNSYMFYNSAGVGITAIASSVNWKSVEMFTQVSGASYIKGFQLTLSQLGHLAQAGYEELKINDIAIYYRILAAH